jgi:hypothetical protein
LPDNCPVRSELGSQLINVIQDVYRLRADSGAAKAGSDMQTALLDLLLRARQNQRNAQRALSDHIKDHGCPK